MNETQELSHFISDELSRLKGLTEEEVRSRQATGQGRDEPRVPTIGELVRKYLITVFNIGLFSLVCLQLLFNKPEDALITALLLIVGIALNVGQEAWARRRLSRIDASRQETVRVIRNGTMEIIEYRDVVVGDVLLANHGDLIAADGEVLADWEFLVDDSFLTGETVSNVKTKGDRIFAGSICVGGEAAPSIFCGRRCLSR